MWEASLSAVLLVVCSLSLPVCTRGFTGFRASLAAVFFVTYDTLKQTLPTPPHLAPVNHMLSASIGEVVRFQHPVNERRLTAPTRPLV